MYRTPIGIYEKNSLFKRKKIGDLGGGGSDRGKSTRQKLIIFF